MTFPKKRGCGYSPLGLEPPSPAALRRTTGCQTGQRSDASEDQTVEKFEVDEAGRAK